LPDTTTSSVCKKIMGLREQGGVMALGRVLTLVVVTNSGLEEEAVEAANEPSREHPSRIIVLPNEPDPQAAALDQASSTSVLAAEIEGAPDSPNPLLMAAWLNIALDVPVAIVPGTAGTGLRRVRLTLPDGTIELLRPGALRR
jgi:hypothetical protein